jgi:hypothetical protein
VEGWKIDKRVILVGFATGVALGISILGAKSSGDAAVDSSSIATELAKPDDEHVTKPGRELDDDGGIVAQGLRANTDDPSFQDMLEEYAAANNGQVSLRVMAALAEMYGQVHGVPPSLGDRSFSGARTSMQFGSDYGRAGVTSDPYAMLRSMTPRSRQPSDASRSSESNSWERYQRATGGANDGFADAVPGAPPNIGAINIGSGQYMAPAGPGAYVDPRDGTYYAPSGPNGVVNTRTGEYSPISH